MININEEKIADLAVKALLYEVSISPKPGLVTRFSNGSHKDMNFYTFIDSALSLKNYFKECFKYGKREELKNIYENDKFLKNLRKLGLQAEKNMFLATKKINTHKGTIFSMGIFISIFSLEINKLLEKESSKIFTKSFFKKIVKKIKKISYPLKKELEENSNTTAGEKIFKKYGIKGARGLALSGYELVLVDGIEKLKKYNKSLDFENSCILVLIYYISVLDDTNIISRSNKETLDIVKDKAQVIFYKNKVNTDIKKLKIDVEELNSFFIERNISSGGSADLLILSIFIYFLENEITNKIKE